MMIVAKQNQKQNHIRMMSTKENSLTVSNNAKQRVCCKELQINFLTGF